ncbi:RNA polymerase sigma-70 factor [Mucilaginibacter sabulilitoris]|uniref:RNA polymerase sigma-70 factor n=1 Tax=Mucilaginibacter sabulilitoris TaxID=1173583 RepID=A0ABZ0TIT4_9SPHI|nr:RNA polymerase sigma-70 factor [Mucilaginibacter sabulilitoris]WPU92709.1 RNA polymerase sigma-70 factor [Mucilaginibacter sabulilitoris]
MLKSPLSDDELWNAIRCDNELAFTALFDRYWVRLYKAAHRYLKDHEAAEEVVHDVFLNIWNRRHQLEIESFPNFLLTATRYQVYNRMRSAKSPIVLTASDVELNELLDHNIGEDHIKDQELQQELDQYLDQLPKRCQEIFYMSRINHLSNQEIAGKLGISKRTVENQITVALKHLRTCFKHMSTIIILGFIIR